MRAICKICLRLFAAVCFYASVAHAAEAAKTNYYVQLIRASNDPKPPTPHSVAIGPKLAARLCPVFTWANYWEITRKEVHLAPGQKTRVRLSPDREVEIDLTSKGKRIVAAYTGGKPVTRSTQASSLDMTIIGGDRDKTASWFIIVRHEKPAN